MTAKRTRAEAIFEEFCILNRITCERIQENIQPTPDYKVILNNRTVLVEIKQIDEDDKFANEGGYRISGSHIRKKIEQARKQAQTASNSSIPFILLVYNNLDEFQLFGTEPHDFINAMYGEKTLVFNTRKNAITNSFQGKNRSLSDDKNTSFSAVGHLEKTQTSIDIKIYENIYAKYKLDFLQIPDCITAKRI